MGINASDINFTAGKYTPGLKPPFDAGFESLGEVLAVGPSVGSGSGSGIKVGQFVVTTSYGAFAEFQILRASQVFPVPDLDPKYLPLLVSGLTASIALEAAGEMKQVGVNGETRKTVLVTAAAGATGSFAVQLAHLAGHHVIATCSSSDKAAFLRSLGADRVVNYREENLGAVLKAEYPRGIDIVYESVGGDMFATAVKHLAVRGKCVIIGFLSGYQDQSGWKGAPASTAARAGKGGNAGAASAASSSSSSEGDKQKPSAPSPPLPALLLGKSASVRGFFLNDYRSDFKRHLAILSSLIAQGKLQSVVDEGSRGFRGLEAIPQAIDYLYQSKNTGKIFVDVAPELHKDEGMDMGKQKKQQVISSKL